MNSKEDILLTDEKIKQMLNKKRTNRMRFIKNPSKIINEETIIQVNKPSSEKEINLNESLFTNFIKPASKTEELTKG